ncbi:MAG: hypothetical protein Q7R77_04250 [Candidatus Daviesbacteria bacterium]|nr:hypothetical protein [Candidatus Daviesbacteria bacterium]
MILWLVLFFIVIAISFVLAWQSMRDYREMPLKSKEEYALFLIRSTENLTAKTLSDIREHIVKDGLIISFERLFKGKRAALTIFGPKWVLKKFTDSLALLELEDYSLKLNDTDVHLWEMGSKSKDLKEQISPEIFKNLPSLGEEEQFLWQVVLGAKGDKLPVFQSQIRAAVYAKDSARRRDLVQLFQNISTGELIKVPKPFSHEQMMSFYRLRSLGKDSEGLLLYPEKILKLIKF